MKEHLSPDVFLVALAVIMFSPTTWMDSGHTMAQAPGLVSGEPLRVDANDGVGLLSTPNAYKTIPIGCAHAHGSHRPDVFVNATRGIECALYLYRWLRDNERGQPVFAPPVKVDHPFGRASAPNGTIYEDHGGVIRGLWIDGTTLVRCVFDQSTCSFRKTGELEVKGLPREPLSITVVSAQADHAEVVVGCTNGVSYRPPGDATRDDYVLYDGAGVFRGQWPYVSLYQFRVAADLSKLLAKPQRIGSRRDQIRGSRAPLTAAEYHEGEPRDVIAGSLLGNLHFFQRRPDDPEQFDDKLLLFDTGRLSIRHPTHGAAPVTYPNRDGQWVDLLVGGEGALHYYRFADRTDEGGHPIYEDAEPVWQQDALLFAGTLPTPNAVDWDGDEATDLVVGNSEGKVLLFRNQGDNRHPKFGVGEPLSANRQVIHVQPGYYGIQGPFEARWGYTCPTVADWNSDGMPDLLLSSATAKHTVFLNVGSRNRPQLTWGTPLYFEGLELHGVWRVKPGVARVGNRMMYVIQDDSNSFHLYWRLDNYNVEDGGQLRVKKGTVITSHITGGDTSPGQKGRGKIEVVDWDGDGKLDLIIGTAKRGSIPEPDLGLPWSRRRRGERSLQVVFLRNVGSNMAPVYEHPRQFQFKGEDIYLGAHANSPVACDLGEVDQGPNLLVGMESGRIVFFHHDDLTFSHSPEVGNH